jgi:phosphoglycerate dehydrogenase-like enzyme
VFEVEELRGKTLGLVGYGAIGTHVAQLGHAYGMRVVALRSHPSLSQPDVDSGLLVSTRAAAECLQRLITCVLGTALWRHARLLDCWHLAAC